LATPQNLKQLEKKIKAREEQKKQELEQARQLAAKINETTIVIRAKVGEKGKLYGSITNNDVAAKLSEQGIEVDKRKIDLKDPIKEVGFYTIGIKVHPEVYAELRVQVEAEKEENKQEEEEQGEEK